MLLTGATGFLGCRLLRELLAHGERAITVLGRGTPEALRHRVEAAVRWLDTPPLAPGAPGALGTVRYVSADLTRPGLGLSPGERARVTEGATALWHCAALLDLGDDPAPLHHANVIGTRRVLELADEAPSAHLLHVSTAYVAGRRSTGVVMEDDLLDTEGFQIPYEESKYNAERLVHAWANRTGRDATVFRPSLLATDRPVPPGLPAQPADTLLDLLRRHLRNWERAVPAPALPRRPRDEGRVLRVRVTGDPEGRLNLLQADYAAHAMVRAAKCPHHGAGVRTLHVTHPRDVPFATITEALRSRFPYLSVTMTDGRVSRRTPLERLSAEYRDLLTYSAHRRTYDRTNLLTSLDGLPDPGPVDLDYLVRAFAPVLPAEAPGRGERNRTAPYSGPEPSSAGVPSPAVPSARHTSWTSVRAGRRDARLRLYCFPFVGAEAAVYLPLAEFLPDSVELCSLEAPGRGGRSGEALMSSVPELVQALTGVVTADAGARRFAFFGHCTGGLLAYETACALAAAGRPGPDLLAVSGVAPPHAYAARVAEAVRNPALLTSLMDELVADARLRGVAEGAVAEAELLNHVLHVPAPAPPLSCPVTVTGGEDDSFFTPGLLDGWSTHTTAGTPTPRLYPGNHMYLMDQWSCVAHDLTEDWAAVPRRAGTAAGQD
ncbi:SDR family oxidoreductase [Streptomyces daliensis]